MNETKANKQEMREPNNPDKRQQVPQQKKPVKHPRSTEQTHNQTQTRKNATTQAQSHKKTAAPKVTRNKERKKRTRKVTAQP
ncbi:hypothetical protein [Bacteroides graminisolvens]|uniref:hypothetical protein n=1 Tax=Bacteroides graminisolvens TaxID=477666 RepID=UPI000483744A|nr:hypothetical protein [Bacteroides graminisolvens]